MRLVLADIASLPVVRLPEGERAPCDGAVFRDDYAQCRNRAVQRRGRWQLCPPHGRKGELEVVEVDT